MCVVLHLFFYLSPSLLRFVACACSCAPGLCTGTSSEPLALLPIFIQLLAKRVPKFGRSHSKASQNWPIIFKHINAKCIYTEFKPTCKMCVTSMQGVPPSWIGVQCVFCVLVSQFSFRISLKNYSLEEAFENTVDVKSCALDRCDIGMVLWGATSCPLDPVGLFRQQCRHSCISSEACVGQGLQIAKVVGVICLWNESDMHARFDAYTTRYRIQKG